MTRSEGGWLRAILACERSSMVYCIAPRGSSGHARWPVPSAGRGRGCVCPSRTQLIFENGREAARCMASLWLRACALSHALGSVLAACPIDPIIAGVAVWRLGEGGRRAPRCRRLQRRRAAASLGMAPDDPSGQRPQRSPPPAAHRTSQPLLATPRTSFSLALAARALLRP
jgi:hypothetical protein